MANSRRLPGDEAAPGVPSASGRGTGTNRPAETVPAWEWSAIWQSDRLESCLPVDGSVSRECLDAAWRQFFASLPDDASILDLGSGNGSVTLQAAKVARGRPSAFTIHGVDLADIDPPRFVPSAAELLCDVVFHPRTAMEALPFDGASFDAVTSQYALEYSETERSLAEAFRVLRPGGSFRFLMHADDGYLKGRCREQRRQAETILKSRLFADVRDLLGKLFLAESSNSRTAIDAAEQAIETLRQSFEGLDRALAEDADRSMTDNLFAAVRQLPALRHSHDLETLLQMAADIERLLAAQATRMQAMERAALAPAAAAGLQRYLPSLGAPGAVLERATAGEACVGYWLYGSKANTETRLVQ